MSAFARSSTWLNSWIAIQSNCSSSFSALGASDVGHPVGMTAREWIEPPAIKPMTGSEPFIGVEATVLDFWRFAMGDFRTNSLRGYLAEYIVGRAVGSDQNRVEWDTYDVITPSGVTIEVKSSGYLQAWAQSKSSNIKFGGLKSKKWTPQTGYAEIESYNAQIYVFCVETATSHDQYNPLDLSQWEFYVISSDALEATGQRSFSLSRVRALAGGSLPFEALSAAIQAAGR